MAWNKEDAKQVFCFCCGMIFMLCVFIGATVFVSERQSAEDYYQRRIELKRLELNNAQLNQQ